MAKTTKDAGPLIKQTKERALARNKARLADLLALIRRRITEVVETFYEIGEALVEIVEHKLYAAEGHRSLAALLEGEELLSRSQANKIMAVVRKMPREQALKLGLERAYALVTYADATPEADSASLLLAENATIGDKPITEASGHDITKAAREVRAQTKVKRPPTPAAREKANADAALRKALRAHLRSAKLERAEIKFAGDNVQVTFSRRVALKLTRAQ